MPYVKIQVIGSPSREQKEQLVREVTDSLARILGKDPNRTTVVIQEVAEENWGIGGMLRDDWVRQREGQREGETGG